MRKFYEKMQEFNNDFKPELWKKLLEEIEQLQERRIIYKKKLEIHENKIFGVA